MVRKRPNRRPCPASQRPSGVLWRSYPQESGFPAPATYAPSPIRRTPTVASSPRLPVPVTRRRSSRWSADRPRCPALTVVGAGRRELAAQRNGRTESHDRNVCVMVSTVSGRKCADVAARRASRAHAGPRRADLHCAKVGLALLVVAKQFGLQPAARRGSGAAHRFSQVKARGKICRLRAGRSDLTPRTRLLESPTTSPYVPPQPPRLS
jgi:hypothetical protein